MSVDENKEIKKKVEKTYTIGCLSILLILAIIVIHFSIIVQKVGAEVDKGKYIFTPLGWFYAYNSVNSGNPVKIQALHYENFFTLKTIGATRYATDGNNVYVSGHRIPHADPATFEIINQSYAKDSDNVYYNDEIISGADSSTFEIIDKFGYSAKDKNNVYWYDHSIVSNADPATFKVIDKFYAIDNKNVYYKKIILPNIDPNSFSLITSDYIKDQNHVYYHDTDYLPGDHIVLIENADPDSFVVLDNGYSKDKYHEYYKGIIHN